MAKSTESSKKSSLYILLGIVLVVALFVLSALFSAWTSVKTFNSKWSSSKVFSSITHNDKSPIAVLEVEGVIFDSEELLEGIAAIEENSSVKGVLLRINSPGGAVAPTQEILGALQRIAKDTKLICSFADIAASGGYYLATACSKIFTNPGTLTGSIGVIMPFLNLQELYKFAKVEPMTIKAGRFKDIGSPSRPMNPDEQILLQNMADEIHLQFKGAIKASRDLSDSAIQQYADGRIFLGSQAVDYGFADAIGGEHDALSELATELDVPMPEDIPRYPIKKPEYQSFFGILASMMGIASGAPPEAPLATQSEQVISWITSKAPELHPMLSSGVPYFLPYTWFSQTESKKATTPGRSRR